jgi:thiamine-phosphate pyrophosphorylase
VAGSGIARCYSVGVTARQPTLPRLPTLWLITDARTDATLDRAIARLPRGSGVIFRHYHLTPETRAARLAHVRRLCRRFGHRLEVGGQGYGPPAPHRRLATAHNLREVGRANRCGAQAVLVSPVFSTRSHPGAPTLGRVRLLVLARRAQMPTIALGGMTAHKFATLRSARPAIHGWAAIDGLSASPDGTPADDSRWQPPMGTARRRPTHP